MSENGLDMSLLIMFSTYAARLLYILAAGLPPAIGCREGVLPGFKLVPKALLPRLLRCKLVNRHCRVTFSREAQLQSAINATHSL